MDVSNIIVVAGTVRRMAAAMSLAGRIAAPTDCTPLPTDP